MKKDHAVKLTFLILILAGAAIADLFFAGSSDPDEYIFMQIRLPKMITALVAGSTLSVAGLILQVIFRNPLAGPYVLGISSGASLTVALAMMGSVSVSFFQNYFAGRGLLLLSSLAGSLAVTALILTIARKVKGNIVLLLIGLMIAQICGALQGALEYFADPSQLKSFVMWSMGSLSSVTLEDSLLLLALGFSFLAFSFLLVKPLQAFLMGQNYARTAGIDYERSRFRLILVSSALTAFTTAFCGPIAFVGISVPILSRMIFSTSAQAVQLTASILIGASLLLFSDLICHSFPNVTLPVNMITTVIGAPLVILMLFRNKET